MTPSGSNSPVPARGGDLSQEIIRKRPSFRRADDLERAGHLAPALGGSAQETKLASNLSDKKSAAPVAPAQGIKNSWPPDFDDAIKWVGRVI
jgi:hypothetical protein